MAKLEYVTPCVNEEVFAADEYVAACWGVACDRAKENGAKDWQEETNNVSHHKYPEGAGCGYVNNQWIKTDASGNVTMKEIKTDGLGTLTCTITGDNWEGIRSLNKNDLNTGDMIYWTTSSGNRTWHHKGVVNISGNGTNHS